MGICTCGITLAFDCPVHGKGLKLKTENQRLSDDLYATKEQLEDWKKKSDTLQSRLEEAEGLLKRAYSGIKILINAHGARGWNSLLREIETHFTPTPAGEKEK